MRLYLLRHGQTHSNVSGALDTAFPGADLTDLGQRQAQAASRALEDRGIGAISVSTLARTHQTAGPTATQLGLTPVEHDGLREITAGDFEMRADETAVLGYLGTIAHWLEGDLASPMPGGETGTAFPGAVRRSDRPHLCAGCRVRAGRQPRCRDPHVGDAPGER
ncbi:histidine phosphatase family protein [Nocardioides sp. B-3]|uniref:histidine phosphatase family protein n=1 Tax=Nocardioides sp. B-3 TaxID=2895565 RepID=UPI0021520C4C|nr:histidine phosphatase family protein [Nocardioides sp. B-3]UUZ59127.1 histidine phosphatase family protein [Nocardioides sp. B-3]